MRNKFLTSRLEGQTLHCPLCSDALRVVVSSSHRARVSCDDCGMSMIVEKDTGARRLLRRIDGRGPNGRGPSESRASGEDDGAGPRASNGKRNGDPFVRRQL